MSSTTRKLRKSGLAALIAATAVTGLTALPAHADANGIASTASAEVGNGPCAHGGYQDGLNQTSSCSSSGGEAHAWCADFVGWVWANNGVAHLGDLDDSAASVFDYGRRYGTLHSSPQVGDAVVYNYNYSTDWAAHVALVTGVGGGVVTITGGNEGHSRGYVNGVVSTESTSNYSVGSAPWGQTISGYISPIFNNTPAATPNPSTLPTGTLVKASGASVKVIINGAGVPIAGSDVTPDGYDLSKIVTVDDNSFNALPAVPPTGTVVMDQAGGAARYVVVSGVALPISASEWTADGYANQSTMGVPSSWLQGAVQGTLPSGTVVMDQANNSPNRYVMVNGAALPITGAEWTADGYADRPQMGVPGTWLQSAIAASPTAGTVVMDQSGTDASRYVMVNGAALSITASEWTADGYNTRPVMGVPGTWLAGAAAKSPANGTVLMDQSGTDASRYVMVGGAAVPISANDWTADGFSNALVMGVPGTWLASSAAKQVADGSVVKNASGADPQVYVMAGGMAVPLTAADFTGLGYDKRPLQGVPGAWEAAAAAKPAPADGTLLLSPDSATVWLVTNGGSKKALTQADFGPGKYSFNNVVSVPTTLTTKLPTVTQ
ncbi:CHAP domain-containing protein [Kitasatospora sp. NPDC004669]|uniref:CHAP domain-containing protein n=1 Tax=Kitasatospora sp. NPDC004669 TaxID=3154555 RepID=UPI00339E9957